MKNQCRPESEDSELDFVSSRPLLTMDSVVCAYPPVRRPLHCDGVLHAFEVEQPTPKSAVIVLERGGDQNDLSACLQDYRSWATGNAHYIANHSKFGVAEIDADQYIAGYFQLLGQCALELPGKFREANDEWLNAALQRVYGIKQQAAESGLSCAFTPSLTAGCRLFGELCVAPFGVFRESSFHDRRTMKELSSAATFLKTLYWLIAGMNLFDENADAPSLLSKWSFGISLRSAEIIRSVLDKGAEVEFEHVLQELNVVANKSADTKKDNSRSDLKSGLQRVAAMRQIKSTLQREVIASVKDPASFANYGLSPVSSVLFFGPSGCGKTLLAKCLAEELGLLMVQIRPSDLTTMYARESVMRIRDCFDDAIKNAPCVLFFDEFDALVPERSKLERFQDFRVEEVNEILTQLDRAKEQGIFLIAATNQPFSMDRGIFQAGRFERVTYVAPPEEDDRVELLEHFMQGRPAMPDLDLEEFASRLDGFSVSDVRTLVEEASRLALFLGKSPISKAMLNQALSRVPASISRDTEKRFEKFIAHGYSG